MSFEELTANGRNCQDLWIKIFYATMTSASSSVGRFCKGKLVELRLQHTTQAPP